MGGWDGAKSMSLYIYLVFNNVIILYAEKNVFYTHDDVQTTMIHPHVIQKLWINIYSSVGTCQEETSV